MNVQPSSLPLPDLRDECLEDAECLFDPELHNGPDPAAGDEHPDVRTAREDIAKDICATCPAQVACLEYAIRVRPVRGIWAGLTADEIAQVAMSRTERESTERESTNTNEFYAGAA
ncbi:WhiB family transcriptional regulator [Actinomadura xylanilytica]|uniref:WhiB family transcriptional regulator n=1 Tax=Actinomadura xylanilytica TaxID=887459 RepID=UPI00255B3875|nr:WhiB family transcriptional regulator [Actinomadura xylanilytica]MDL4777594.1 WhiB family transcriptional regulator [Actinomadura xylanilytica]